MQIFFFFFFFFLQIYEKEASLILTVDIFFPENNPDSKFSGAKTATDGSRRFNA